MKRKHLKLLNWIVFGISILCLWGFMVTLQMSWFIAFLNAIGFFLALKKIPVKSSFDFKKMSKKFDEILENITPEEIEKYFPKDNRPEGWISIEDSLPECFAEDFFKKGYTSIKVKDNEGNECFSQVCDPLIWYHEMKIAGITHWWHE